MKKSLQATLSYAICCFLSVAMLAVATMIFHGRRVRASNTDLELVAARYPAGSEDQRMAVLAELQRERHPFWKDLSLDGAMVRLVELGQHGLQPRASGSATQTAANFFGNLTTISGLSQKAFVLARQADCSLTKLDGTYVFSMTNPGFTVNATTSNFERTLHSAAGLTTTAGGFAGGCASPPTGISSRRAIYTGKTSQGLSVFAAAGYNVTARGNAIYLSTADSNNRYHSYDIDTSNPNVNSVATGDFNGDGVGDLVEVNQLGTSASITLLTGRPDGSFVSPVTYPVALESASSAVVDDFNGDGKLDVVVVSTRHTPAFSQAISVLTGRGDGTLIAASTFTVPSVMSAAGSSIPIANVISADLRGIGRKDLVTSNGLVFLSKGDGTFVAASANAFPGGISSSNFGPNLAAGDINHDGHVDLVVDDGQRISIYLGKGDGTFVAAGGYATIDNVGYITITDLDGDGNADIYSGLANGAFFGGDQFGVNSGYALMGNGDGTFRGAPSLPVSFTGQNLADVNGDKKLDMVGLAGTTFTTYLGKGDGSFSIGPTLDVASFSYAGQNYTTTGVTSFAVGDLDGDGRADLIAIPANALSSSGSPFYLIALGQSDGSFATPTVGVFPGVAATGDFDNNFIIGDLHVADVNGDGSADLVYSFSDVDYKIFPLTQTYLQGFGVLPGNGNGTFQAAGLTTISYSSAAAPTLLPPTVDAIVDLNRDAKPDLLAVARIGTPATGFGYEARLYLNKGDGSFGTGAVVPTAVNPRSILAANGPPVVAADLNGDGNLDLISIGEDSSGNAQLGIALGKGDGTFNAVKILALSGGDIIQSSGLAVGDVNGDGKADVVITSFLPTISGVYLGNGDGTVQAITDSAANISPLTNFKLNVFGASAIRDFNGDGKADVLVGNTILLNLGAQVTVPPTAASTTTLVASPGTLTVGQTVKLTATVAGLAGATLVPTGTVTFTDSLAGAAVTTLGSATLDSSGAGAFSTAMLGAGSHAITASYGGSGSYTSSISSVTTVVVAAVQPADFTLALGSSSGTASTTMPASTMVRVTPVNGFNQAVSFTCSGQPASVTCGFSPATVTPAGAAATTTLTFTRTTSSAVTQWRSGIVFAVAGCCWMLAGMRRRRTVGVLGFLVLLSGSLWIAGCGESSKVVVAPLVSAVTVTASAGATTHTATYTLTSQ